MDDAAAGRAPTTTSSRPARAHSVRELVEIAFGHAGLDWQDFVKEDPAFLRPAEVDHLIGDPRKAKAKFGWTPSVDFDGLVKMMVDADLERHSK